MKQRDGVGSQLPIKKKLVIVGDGECGKTSLLIVFAKDEFPEYYVPTIFETYTVEIQVCEYWRQT
jgi:GTPase SAR1 family protein